jgi:undecaprenyl-diphosphatase
LGAEAEGLNTARAAALGVVQGPAELLPVSSSAHLTLIPWLAGWGWDDLDAEARKSFEVAVHAGAAAALLIGQRRRIADELRAFDKRRALVVGLSFVPPAIVGYRFERAIEGRLGGPRATAAGLLAGSAAMVLADRRPQRRGPGDAGAVDGLALRPPLWSPGYRETARRCRPRERASSPASRRTCCRGPSRCP